MVHWKTLWSDALDNARNTPREKWFLVAAIFALMMITGAFSLIGGAP